MSINYSRLLCFALAAVSASAMADTWIWSGTGYKVYRTQIPDFDQLKSGGFAGPIKGLPNDGKMYCVPTAAFNNLAYAADHGYPLLDPGPGNWEFSPPTHTAEYNFITGIQFLTGILCSTDPINGTGGIKTVMQNYLDGVYPGQFAVTELVADGTYAPSVADGANAMYKGSLVSFCYGWYGKKDVYDGGGKYHTRYVRNGGHCTTMVGAQNWLGTVNVTLHDPAKMPDNDWFSQSHFTDEVSTYQNIKAEFAYKNGSGMDVNINTRTLQKIDYSGGYLDNLMMFTPKYAFTYKEDEIIFITPINWNPREPVSSIKRISANVGKIADLAINPFLRCNAFITDSADAIFTVDPNSGDVKRMAKVSKPKRLVYGDDQELILLRNEQLDIYDADGNRLKNIGLQRPLDAIAWDGKNKQVVGYNRAQNRLYYFSRDLRRLSEVALPAVQLPPNPCKMFIDDLGNIYLHGKGGRSITKIGAGRLELTVRQIPVPEEIENAEGAFVDEAGRIFVLGDGSVHPIDASGRIDRHSPFFGMPAGGSLSILRPYANMQPNPARDPSFINVLPPYAGR